MLTRKSINDKSKDPQLRRIQSYAVTQKPQPEHVQHAKFKRQYSLNQIIGKISTNVGSTKMARNLSTKGFNKASMKLKDVRKSVRKSMHMTTGEANNKNKNDTIKIEYSDTNNTKATYTRKLPLGSLKKTPKRVSLDLVDYPNLKLYAKGGVIEPTDSLTESLESDDSMFSCRYTNLDYGRKLALKQPRSIKRKRGNRSHKISKHSTDRFGHNQKTDLTKSDNMQNIQQINSLLSVEDNQPPGINNCGLGFSNLTGRKRSSANSGCRPVFDSKRSKRSLYNVSNCHSSSFETITNVTKCGSGVFSFKKSFKSVKRGQDNRASRNTLASMITIKEHSPDPLKVDNVEAPSDTGLVEERSLDENQAMLRSIAKTLSENPQTAFEQAQRRSLMPCEIENKQKLLGELEKLESLCHMNNDIIRIDCEDENLEKTSAVKKDQTVDYDKVSIDSGIEQKTQITVNTHHQYEHTEPCESVADTAASLEWMKQYSYLFEDTGTELTLPCRKISRFAHGSELKASKARSSESAEASKVKKKLGSIRERLRCHTPSSIGAENSNFHCRKRLPSERLDHSLASEENVLDTQTFDSALADHLGSESRPNRSEIEAKDGLTLLKEVERYLTAFGQGNRELSKQEPVDFGTARTNSSGIDYGSSLGSPLSCKNRRNSRSFSPAKPSHHKSVLQKLDELQAYIDNVSFGSPLTSRRPSQFSCRKRIPSLSKRVHSSMHSRLQDLIDYIVCKLDKEKDLLRTASSEDNLLEDLDGRDLRTNRSCLMTTKPNSTTKPYCYPQDTLISPNPPSERNTFGHHFQIKKSNKNACRSSDSGNSLLSDSSFLMSLGSDMTTTYQSGQRSSCFKRSYVYHGSTKNLRRSQCELDIPEQITGKREKLTKQNTYKSYFQSERSDINHTSIWQTLVSNSPSRNCYQSRMSDGLSDVEKMPSIRLDDF